MKIQHYFILTAFLVFQSCMELDIRPNSSIVLPTKAEDFQRLLDHEAVSATPALPHLHGDEHLLNDYESWQRLPRITQRRSYTWEIDLYQGEENIPDWNTPYLGIFHCNSVLDHVDVIKGKPDYESIKGRALFARAYLFYGLLCSFAPVYNAATADSDLGIPLKLSSAIDEVQQRATISECYRQIIEDALTAETLIHQPYPSGNRNKPSKAAVFAFLARVYLGMGNYPEAEEYATKSLDTYNVLTDHNTLDTLAMSPFTYNTAETIYFSRQVYGYITNANLPYYHVNPELVNLFHPDDLRRKLYFSPSTEGRFWIKPINTFTGLPFTGLAVDEMYLIKAECLARRGDPDGALALLNTLLESRFTAGKFRPVAKDDGYDILDLVLTERRRSLIYRCQRWEDLKRLNREGYNITLRRELNGDVYELPPNDLRYVFPIPDDEIAHSGIQQNIRE